MNTVTSGVSVVMTIYVDKLVIIFLGLIFAFYHILHVARFFTWLGNLRHLFVYKATKIPV